MTVEISSPSGASVPVTGTYAATTTSAQTASVTGDTNPRFERLADGTMQYGPGNAVADMITSRPAVGSFRVAGSHATKVLEVTNLAGTGFFQVGPNGVVCAAADFVMANGYNMQFNTQTGTKIGAATGQKMGFWNATPIVQPTRAGQLTDSSGGTSGGATIAAIGGAIDPTSALKADTANAIATLAAKVNAIEGKLSAAAGGSGMTA